MYEIPDPRAPYNQRHKFLDIIIIAITAALAGMDTWNKIVDWAACKKVYKTCVYRAPPSPKPSYMIRSRKRVEMLVNLINI